MMGLKQDLAFARQKLSLAREEYQDGFADALLNNEDLSEQRDKHYRNGYQAGLKQLTKQVG